MWKKHWQGENFGVKLKQLICVTTIWLTILGTSGSTDIRKLGRRDSWANDWNWGCLDLHDCVQRIALTSSWSSQCALHNWSSAELVDMHPTKCAKQRYRNCKNQDVQAKDSSESKSRRVKSNMEMIWAFAFSHSTETCIISRSRTIHARTCILSSTTESMNASSTDYIFYLVFANSLHQQLMWDACTTV